MCLVSLEIQLHPVSSSSLGLGNVFLKGVVGAISNNPLMTNEMAKCAIKKPIHHQDGNL